MLKSEKNIFWGIIAVFVLTRMAIILFFIDTAYNSKETYVGFVSTELRDLKIPLLDYIMKPRHFSNLLISILMAPFIFIFGNNLISIKLFALFIATINLGVWYLLLRNISQRAALFFFTSIYIHADHGYQHNAYKLASVCFNFSVHGSISFITR